MKLYLFIIMQCPKHYQKETLCFVSINLLLMYLTHITLVDFKLKMRNSLSVITRSNSLFSQKFISFDSVKIQRDLPPHTHTRSILCLFGEKFCQFQRSLANRLKLIQKRFTLKPKGSIYITISVVLKFFYFLFLHSYPSEFVLINHTGKLTYILHTSPLTKLES